MSKIYFSLIYLAISNSIKRNAWKDKKFISQILLKLDTNYICHTSFWIYLQQGTFMKLNKFCQIEPCSALSVELKDIMWHSRRIIIRICNNTRNFIWYHTYLHLNIKYIFLHLKFKITIYFIFSWMETCFQILTCIIFASSSTTSGFFYYICGHRFHGFICKKVYYKNSAY